MESYFFIPANNTKYLSKRDTILADNIVLELEDGIPESDIELAFNNILNIKEKSNYWVRPNISFQLGSDTLLRKIVKAGFNKILLPKIESLKELDEYEDILACSDNKIILLVESPRLLLELKDVLKKYRFEGLAFGIHDFARSFDTFPNYQKFKPYVFQLLLLCKAYRIKYIDSPSMNLSDESIHDFQKEVSFISSMGADGKLIIHPKQLYWFNEVCFYSKEQVNWAKKVNKEMEMTNADIKDFKSFVMEDEVIEKAHIKLVGKILRWHENRK